MIIHVQHVSPGDAFGYGDSMHRPMRSPGITCRAAPPTNPCHGHKSAWFLHHLSVFQRSEWLRIGDWKTEATEGYGEGFKRTEGEMRHVNGSPQTTDRIE